MEYNIFILKYFLPSRNCDPPEITQLANSNAI